MTRACLTPPSQWTGPQYRPITPLNIPGRNYTLAQPLGVVLILGVWNYPTHLSLVPLVGAIAGVTCPPAAHPLLLTPPAGNCAALKLPESVPHVSHVLSGLMTRHLDVRCIRGVEVWDRHGV